MSGLWKLLSTLFSDVSPFLFLFYSRVGSKSNDGPPTPSATMFGGPFSLAPVSAGPSLTHSSACGRPACLVSMLARLHEGTHKSTFGKGSMEVCPNLEQDYWQAT